MTRATKPKAEPIHAEECSCSRCNPPRPGQIHSPALAAALAAICAGVFALATAWAASWLHDQLFTFQTF